MKKKNKKKRKNELEVIISEGRDRGLSDFSVVENEGEN